jgi:Mn-dependent DtxR family transcriptional regulator
MSAASASLESIIEQGAATVNELGDHLQQPKKIVRQVVERLKSRKLLYEAESGLLIRRF